MKYIYDLVEKIEIEGYPPEDGDRLIKTWRNFILLKGDDTTGPVAFGEKCDEIILDPNGNVRIGGERFVEEIDPDRNDPLFFLKPYKKNLNNENLSDEGYVLEEQKQINLICAELNKSTMNQMDWDLRKLRKLPNIVGNNSENRVFSMFLENVLYLFMRWYDGVNLIPPVDVKKFWPLENENDSIALKSGRSKIDQDDFMSKFTTMCLDLQLVKGKKIPVEILFDIGMQISPQAMPSQEIFKDPHPMYRKLRQYASIKGYVNRKET